jgi:hypothetical protein
VGIEAGVDDLMKIVLFAVSSRQRRVLRHQGTMMFCENLYATHARTNAFDV